ncbi:hypothetical protein EDEG_00604 [Edhazardia aedis USNM 41457]|uniref:CMP/dCMP-type deaminase domain-containing protein n=1 Tax=Edhazardia aedis (strain USNM 41457) TaxID=1003232 RepID=J9A0A9_EDHAE|nr:hypothetical protein EDEG_00604 [Edhazardia aedis USNM 41457]|eukprot:EJW05348.1 hypothetical protein EDEG_00604 [Edhazardia aedis USNM 41457]
MKYQLERLKTAEELQELELEEFYVIRVPKEELSKAIVRFSKTNPIYQHLKRAKDASLVLVHSASKELANCMDYKVEMVSVPKRRPITVEQYQVANDVWPCYFFPFKEPKSVEVMKYEKVIDMLFQHEKNLQRNESKILLKSNKDLSNKKKNLESCSDGCSKICVIVDPKTGEVLSSEVDSSDFFGHSVFKCIENVSKSKIGYLCTGYIAFVLDEPCNFCAMAFIHGRIFAVYLVNYRNTFNSAISTNKINYNKNLNHHYAVYRIIKK